MSVLEKSRLRTPAYEGMTSANWGVGFFTLKDGAGLPAMKFRGPIALRFFERDY
jgi:hypothetical protein